MTRFAFRVVQETQNSCLHICGVTISYVNVLLYFHNNIIIIIIWWWRRWCSFVRRSDGFRLTRPTYSLSLSLLFSHSRCVCVCVCVMSSTNNFIHGFCERKTPFCSRFPYNRMQRTKYCSVIRGRRLLYTEIVAVELLRFVSRLTGALDTCLKILLRCVLK